MILVVASAEDEHTLLVESELQRLGCDYLRFDTMRFPQEVLLDLEIGSNGSRDGTIISAHTTIPLGAIRAVWYRYPPTPDIRLPAGHLSRRVKAEAQQFASAEAAAALDGLWSSLSCVWMNHPSRIAEASDKIAQLYLAAQLGFRIPATLVSSRPEVIRRFYELHDRRIVAKAVRHGTISLHKHRGTFVLTHRVEDRDLSTLGTVRWTPVLWQEEIAKRCDIKVVVVGDTIFPTSIHSQENADAVVDFRRARKVTKLPHLIHELPPAVQGLCRRIVQQLRLTYGVVDLILTADGSYVFLEVNPSGRWASLEQLTGQQITNHVARFLSTYERPN